MSEAREEKDFIYGLSLLALIQTKVKLKQRGPTLHVGDCPFCEASKSFNVRSDRQIWHCFQCGAGGTILDYATKHYGLTRFEAIAALRGPTEGN
jgi:DNA primase